LGRFTTKDPLEEININQSPYVYADNNPINLIDFLGLDGDDPPDKKEDNEENTSQAEGSNMDGWGDEAPEEEEFTNPYSMNSEKESKEESTNEDDEEKTDNPLDPSNYDTFEEFMEATENTPDMKEIQAEHEQKLEKLEKRWERQDKIITGTKAVAEGVGVVVGAVAEYAIGVYTGLLFFVHPANDGTNQNQLPPMEQ